MGEIRLGPAGLPDAPSFEEAAGLLAARGYRACEIGFAGGFWLDYDSAPALGEALRAEDIVLSVHAPLAAFMGHVEREKKFKMALGMLDHTAGLAKAAGAEVIVFHPGLPPRPRARAGDRGRRRPARRPARAARGEGPARAVRDRGDGTRARARNARRRARDRVAGRLRPARARLRAHARDERRRVHRRRRVRRPRSRRPTT